MATLRYTMVYPIPHAWKNPWNRKPCSFEQFNEALVVLDGYDCSSVFVGCWIHLRWTKVSHGRLSRIHPTLSREQCMFLLLDLIPACFNRIPCFDSIVFNDLYICLYIWSLKHIQFLPETLKPIQVDHHKSIPQESHMKPDKMSPISGWFTIT